MFPAGRLVTHVRMFDAEVKCSCRKTLFCGGAASAKDARSIVKRMLAECKASHREEP